MSSAYTSPDLSGANTPTLGSSEAQSPRVSTPPFADSDHLETTDNTDINDDVASISSTSTVQRLRPTIKARATTQISLDVSSRDARVPSSVASSIKSSVEGSISNPSSASKRNETNEFLSRMLGYSVDTQAELFEHTKTYHDSASTVYEYQSHDEQDEDNYIYNGTATRPIALPGVSQDNRSLRTVSSRDSLDLGSSLASSYKDDEDAGSSSQALKLEPMDPLPKKKATNGRPIKWSRHDKHFFILSNAGKPIYSRYGDESRLSSHMGVIQAIVSFFVDFDDSLKFIKAGEHKFVFLIKGPLSFVTVAKTGESELQLRTQLDYMYSQVVSVLTLVQLNKIFEERTNFDLRRLLGGTEIFLDSLADTLSADPGIMLGSIQCLRMKRTLRDKVGQYMYSAKCPDLLYGILIADNRLVTLLRPKKHSLHPSDLHLVFNMMAGSSSFRSGESWMPICLPKFNSRGFLHAYVSYLAPEVCLILLSANKDKFFELSEMRSALVESLTASKTLEGIDASLQKHRFDTTDLGIPGLRHFLYKSRANVQYTMPEYVAPYMRSSDQKRLLRMYQYASERMHTKTRPLRIYSLTSNTESILGWITPSFELYATFSPLLPKRQMINSANALLRWIRREEDRLFVTNSPTF